MDMGRHELLVRELRIPPRPEVVEILVEESAREAPNLQRISRAISADVALAGAVLKVVNSPAFRRPQAVASVAQAIDLLGLRNVASLTTGLVLRGAVGRGPSLERFWDSAEKVALICAQLSRQLRRTSPDVAYTYGLFHDAGIPMLMARFPDYKEALREANETEEGIFTAVEERRIGTHHAVVGYFMARSWHLPDTLCQAILMHHEVDVLDSGSEPPGVLDLMAIGHVAQHIHHVTQRDSRDIEWDKFETTALAQLGISDDEFVNLIEDTQALFRTKA